MHDEVRVEVTDGTAYQGWPAAVDWWGPKETAGVFFEVDVEAGDTAVLPIGDITHIELLRGHTDLNDFLEAVGEAVRHATDADSPDLRLIVGDHELIEVEIRKVKNDCDPGPRPAWLL